MRKFAQNCHSFGLVFASVSKFAHTGHVSEQWKRLGRAVEERRLSAALHFATQDQLAALAGVSRRTLTTLETGGRVRRATLTRIEHALDWAPGSVDALLSGGDPTPVEDPAPIFSDPDEAALWALNNLSMSTRMSLIEHLRALKQSRAG